VNIYLTFLKNVIKKLLFLKKNNNQTLIEKCNQSTFNNSVTEHSLPDIETLEHTMFMFQRVRSAFNFSPKISLIPEMRIINKGLSYLYNTPRTHLLPNKNAVSQEVTNIVQKFSYILPEIDFLLTKIENLSVNDTQHEQAEALKEQIIFALEKISYEKNSLISLSPKYCLGQDNSENYHIIFSDDALK
jgi:hypothetical protein